MRKKALGFIIAAVFMLTSFGQALAVTWGAPDGNNHPYVGTILFREGNSYFSCTATLLSPTVMVTAGHCSVGGEDTWVSFDSEITLEGLGSYGSVEEYLDAEWISGTAYPHPQYSDFAEFPNTYDVGVVVLEEAVNMSTYGTLPQLGLLDWVTSGKNHQNRQFTVVGYGSQGILKPITVDEWARYVGTVSLIEVKSTFNGDAASAKFTNNPGKGNGSGGSCFGDSGGPVFYGSTTQIAAVVSWGITPCIGVDYQFRLDTTTAQDFILPFLNGN